MSSILEHFSHPEHPLILYNIFLEEYVAIEEDATCFNCQLPLKDLPTYTCSNGRETFHVHKSCINQKFFRCYGCTKTTIGFPTYICHDSDIDCRKFFLHKTCATLPKQINHQKHKKHPLTLLPCRRYRCDVCRGGWEVFTYTCEDCNFNVCVFCAFKQRALGHEGHRKPPLVHHRHEIQLIQLVDYKLEHFSHPKHPLVLTIIMPNDFIEEDASCHVCSRPVLGSSTYTCTIDDIDCRKFYLHKNCAELPRKIHHHNHIQHSLFLKPCPDCFCDVCGVDVNFAYACGECTSFNVCVFCVSEERGHILSIGMFPENFEARMKLLSEKESLQTLSYKEHTIKLDDDAEYLEHFSHPKHTLKLKENDITGEDEICHVCNKPVIGSPAFTCTNDAIDCESFYLHKTCAELPRQINHNLDKHLLALLPRPDGYLCAVCGCNVKYGYACDDCNINVCVFCGFEQKELRHEGHHDHILRLQREAWFKCDACSENTTDYSYVCTTCDFWIHKTCAFAPSIIPSPTYHHHPLSLIYSVPEMHRYFSRFCAICKKLVQRHHWLYYCHKCTFFVHMKCSTSKYQIREMIQSDANDREPDLVQFPLSSVESLFDLIVTQVGMLQIDFQGEDESSSTVSTISTDDPHLIEEHWSHPIHPLKQFHLTENDDNDADDRGVLICDGCIQPITVHHPSYYACMQCEFFLHSFCATKLPRVFPAEAFPVHPNHSLLLWSRRLFYDFIKCGACSCVTNGFYYQCETCDMAIDIRCAFLPTRIKHESHKHHSLVQRPLSNFICSVSNLRVIDRVGYGCVTCNFTIDILCAFYPSRIKHKYEDDSDNITLRHPPFFYEGVFYCEICEEQVNNQWWLYHCGESDHSYHHNCLQWHDNVKLPGFIKFPGEDEHTFAMVMKRTKRRNSPRYICQQCNVGYKCSYFFECEGCGVSVCLKCIIAPLAKITCA